MCSPAWLPGPASAELWGLPPSGGPSCPSGVPPHRAVDLHDLPEHLGDVGQGVGREAEAARLQELVHELLPQLGHHLVDELLPHLKVLLVLWEKGEGGGQGLGTGTLWSWGQG